MLDSLIFKLIELKIIYKIFLYISIVDKPEYSRTKFKYIQHAELIWIYIEPNDSRPTQLFKFSSNTLLNYLNLSSYNFHVHNIALRISVHIYFRNIFI